jgi:heat shock protein HslJ
VRRERSGGGDRHGRILSEAVIRSSRDGLRQGFRRNKRKYTVAFAADGSFTVRFDCNRGRGSWKSSEKNHVEFGPLALTRAACPRGSLHDRMVKQWPFIRSYVLKGGHLFLSLMADGGIYEFEPG